MKVSCTLAIDFDDAKKAEQIIRSIKVDDFDFVTSKIKGKKLEATIESNSISSLLHTLDDYLACLTVAENVVNKN